MRPFTLLILLGCAVCVVFAAKARTADNPRATQVPPGDTRAQIRALIGDAACTENGQCHTLALGARPCGGPQAYLPWSSARTNGAALAALGKRFKEEREAAIAASDEMSTCRFMPDPGATCKAGTCQLNPVAQDGQSAI